MTAKSANTVVKAESKIRENKNPQIVKIVQTRKLGVYSIHFKSHFIDFNYDSFINLNIKKGDVNTDVTIYGDNVKLLYLL